MANPKPLAGYTYVYSLPVPFMPGEINATCVVFSSTCDGVEEGMTVLVDLVNLDFRRLQISGVQVFVVPNDAVLAIVE
jgi:hypothetical protein